MASKPKPKHSTARHHRNVAYKYYPLGKKSVHSIAVPGGRCHICNRITNMFCHKCSKWVCEKHTTKDEKYDIDVYCVKCKKTN